MDEAARSDVLKRKARSGRQEHQARVMTLPRALRLALARAAEELFGMALSISSIEAALNRQDGTIDAFGPDTLILVLDGPGGALGAISLDPNILTGLIEMQTIGQVLPRAADGRLPTQTDAALVAPLVDAMMAGFADNLADDPAAGWVAGYRFGAMIEEPRMLGLLLDAPDFHLFRLQAELGGGAKSGEIVLALPERSPPDGACGDPSAKPGTGAEGGPCLSDSALMRAEARLMAVLHRIRLPLTRADCLKPGDVLPIPRRALIDTVLDTGPGRDGIACRLGQVNGFRAVRLTGWPVAAEDVPDADADHEFAGAAEASPPRSAAETGAASEATGSDTAAADGWQNLEEGPDGPATAEADPMALPGLPDAGDLGDLPDLPDLSDLPELALGT